MKQFIIAFSFAALALTACNNENKTTSTATETTNDTVAAPAAANSEQAYTSPAGVDAKVSASIKAIVDGYLHVKNALVATNGKDAGTAGLEVVAAVDKVDMTPMNDAQMKVWHEVMDDIKEHGEHISKNASNIAHQREHFESLSKDVEELVKTFGGGQKLYKDFCPMAAEGKGASWVSEIKEIKNPYYGSEMMECGEIKEELK